MLNSITSKLKLLLLITTSSFLFSCGGGGSTPPTTQIALASAKIVNVSSASNDSIVIEWVEGKGIGVNYDVHISINKDFTPDVNNFKANTTDNYITITGLNPQTLYYVIIITKDINGNKTTSNQLSASTVSIAPTAKSGLNTKSVAATISNNTITTNDANTNDIVYNTNGDNAYLKKVVATTTDANGQTIATVEKATIRDIYQNLEISNTTKLVDIDTINTVNPSNSISFAPAINGQASTKFYKKWHTGLSMEQNLITQSTQSTNSVNSAPTVNHAIKINDKKESESETYYDSSVAKYIALEVGDSLSLPIKLSGNNKKVDYEFDGSKGNTDAENQKLKEKCEFYGGTFDDGRNSIFPNTDSSCDDIPVQICSIVDDGTEVDVPENAKNKNNKPYIEIINNQPYIKWTPTKDNIDYEYGKPYEMDIQLDLKAGVFCGTEYEKIVGTDDIDLENIQFNIGESPKQSGLVVNSSVEFDSGNYNAIYSYSSRFTPKIGVDMKIEKFKITKGKAFVHSNLKITNTLTFTIKQAGSHTFDPKPLYTKKFTKIIPTAAGVPIVIIGRLRLMAVLEVEANAELEASANITTDLTMGLDINYNTVTKKWESISTKSITYDINAGGKGEAEVKGTIRIIPSLDISLYDAAAAHFILEPYIYAKVGVSGEINASLSNNQATADSSYQFSALEAGIGMDGKVYVGPAWDATDSLADSLIYPDKAVYAASKLPLTDASFMNPKHISFVKEYYEATNTYEKIIIVNESKVIAIPKLGPPEFDKTKKPPTTINSRAIAFNPTCEKVKNAIYPIGREYYIKCGEWKTEKITNNFDLDKDSTGQYWLTPIAENGNYNNNIFRFVNNSSLNWARQYVRVDNPSIGNTTTLPTYFKDRYGLADSDGDFDDDNFSDLDEFNAGTIPTSASSTPQITSLNTPTNLIATANDTKVALSWDSVLHATDYTIYYSTNQNTINANQLSTTNTNSTITALVNNVKYYFAVVANKDDLKSPQSSVINATPSATKSPISGSFSYPTTTINQGNTTTITADLTNFERGTGEVVFAYNTNITGISVHSKTALINIDNNAPVGNHTYEVYATSSDGGTITTSVNITINQNTISTPTITTATAGSGSVYLAWSGITGATYNLYYAKESFNSLSDISNYGSLNGATLINNLSVNDKTISGLTNGTTYYFVLTAKKDGVESGYENQTILTPSVPIPANTTTATLNDTGITWGGSYPSGNNATCTGVNISAQDCSHGRDAKAAAGTLTKIGAGVAGFDFTKLDSNGNALPASATSWSCVRDNVTKLVWEVKTNTGVADSDTTDATHTNIHHKDNTYRWGGKTAIGKTHASKQGTYYDDWTGLVDGTNAETLCGFNDWRVPTREELRSIVNYGTTNPAIDTNYFPNTAASYFWSSSPGASYSSYAWVLYFVYGDDNYYYRYYSYRVRLVRLGE